MPHLPYVDTAQADILRGDPAADDLVARLIAAGPEPARPESVLRPMGQLVRRQLCNHELREARLSWPELAPAQAELLNSFLRECARMPAWAAPQEIEAAGALFRRHGSICSISLFCASLPEVYAHKNITEVLQRSHRLEEQAAARIRSTAQLVLPIMMEGGLTAPDQCGVASILKARVIHAAVRHLLLRGAPAAVVQQHVQAPKAARAAWDLAERGLPCNQREQGYVILCFSHVLLRSLRALGVHPDAAQQRAFFHAWNVVAHLMGVEEAQMVWDAESAEQRFAELQRDAVSPLAAGDPRPSHARALLDTMASVVPGRIASHFPELLLRRLCPASTLQALGLHSQPPRLPSWGFRLAIGSALAWDRAASSLNCQGLAVETVIDSLGDRFITDILGMDLASLRHAMGKAGAGRWRLLAAAR